MLTVNKCLPQGHGLSAVLIKRALEFRRGCAEIGFHRRGGNRFLFRRAKRFAEIFSRFDQTPRLRRQRLKLDIRKHWHRFRRQRHDRE